jgi:hypothetical protein
MRDGPMRSRLLWLCSSALAALVWAQACAYAAGPVQDVTNQAWRAVAVTPSDTTPLASGATQAIYSAGNAANNPCTMTLYFEGAPQTAVAVGYMTPGFPYPFRVTQVGATGTTCTGIVALYTPPH